jgi:hypothetical protein
MRRTVDGKRRDRRFAQRVTAQKVPDAIAPTIGIMLHQGSALSLSALPLDFPLGALLGSFLTTTLDRESFIAG